MSNDNEIRDFLIFFRMGDPSFGVNKQAMAVMAYLCGSEIEECQPPEVIQSSPMRFEGKIGICLQFKKHESVTEPWLLVYFGEAPDRGAMMTDTRMIVKSNVVRQLEDADVGPTYKDFLRGGQTDFYVEGEILQVYTAITSALLSFML